MTTVRPSPFVLIPTPQGTFIASTLDERDGECGVGWQLLTRGEYEPSLVKISLMLLENRRKVYGDGVVALDCGANIGIFTVGWARGMYGWGRVRGFEPQERLFYALAGNVALNNCFNADVVRVAVGKEVGTIGIPYVDYTKKGSYGSVSLIEEERSSVDVGQRIDLGNPVEYVPLITIDSLEEKRVDFIKIDVEGMDLEVLEGARVTLQRCHPQILVESFQVGIEVIEHFLNPLGYHTLHFGVETVAIHESDPTLGCVKIVQGGDSHVEDPS